MAARKVNYTVTKPFEYGGENYEVGDKFRIMDNWEVDEEYRKLLPKDRKVMVFRYEKPLMDARGNIQREPTGAILSNGHRVILPVE